MTCANAAAFGKGPLGLCRFWCSERAESRRAGLAEPPAQDAESAAALLDDLIDWHVGAWKPGFGRAREWIAEGTTVPEEDA
jgi:hypothetical protein